MEENNIHNQNSSNIPYIVINNTNNNTNTNTNTNSAIGPQPKNKWIAFFLCLFLGWVGAHKFYEGKNSFGYCLSSYWWYFRIWMGY